MGKKILKMAQRLNLEHAVNSATLSGQDSKLVADIVFALYCEMIKTTKDTMTWELALDKHVSHASKLLGIEAIKNDVNYLWDSNW